MGIRYTAAEAFNSGGKDYGIGDVVDVVVASGSSWPADALARRIAHGHIVIDTETVADAALDEATSPSKAAK